MLLQGVSLNITLRLAYIRTFNCLFSVSHLQIRALHFTVYRLSKLSLKIISFHKCLHLLSIEQNRIIFIDPICKQYKSFTNRLIIYKCFHCCCYVWVSLGLVLIMLFFIKDFFFNGFFQLVFLLFVHSCQDLFLLRGKQNYVFY